MLPAYTYIFLVR